MLSGAFTPQICEKVTALASYLGETLRLGAFAK